MRLKISESLKSLPTIDYRELKEFQKDLKKISKENYAKLLKSLNEFGLIVPIFIWKHDSENLVIDAHQRLRVLKGEKAEPFDIPYVEIEADNEQDAKKKLLVISSQYGTTTQDGWNAFTEDLDKEWLTETTYFDALAKFSLDEEPVKTGLTEDDAVPEAPKKPKTKLGDIYSLGAHRVMCGDSTHAESVKKLMGGGVANLMVTDPPYGVKYDPSWREGCDLGVGKRSKGKVLNDDKADWRIS